MTMDKSKKKIILSWLIYITLVLSIAMILLCVCFKKNHFKDRGDYSYWIHSCEIADINNPNIISMPINNNCEYSQYVNIDCVSITDFYFFIKNNFWYFIS